MLSFTVMYTYGKDKKFDWDYYLNKHMGMIKDGLGPRLKKYYVEKGLVGKTPDSPPAFICMLHVLVEGMEDIQEIGRMTPELIADVTNYTDAQASAQISEVISS